MSNREFSIVGLRIKGWVLLGWAQYRRDGYHLWQCRCGECGHIQKVETHDLLEEGREIPCWLHSSRDDMSSAQHKLSPDDARLAEWMVRRGDSFASIAKRFGVTPYDVICSVVTSPLAAKAVQASIVKNLK